MSLILSGSDGVSDIDGTAATPAIRGTDANTGIFFESDVIGFSEGGAEVARFNANAQFVAAAGTALLPVITTTGDVNTGIFFPAADTIAFTEGGVEAMRITSAALLQFNSGYGSVATAYGCRAWVAYDGTGTPLIRANGNVSSLTDLGIGQWLVNFTTSMPDANYCTVATCNEVDNATTCQARLPATSNIAIDIYTSPSGLSNSRADPTRVNVAIFR
jgi:hypothetical protein